MSYFFSGEIILVAVNQPICKSCINFKQNSYSYYKQENHSAIYHRKIYLIKDWFHWA